MLQRFAGALVVLALGGVQSPPARVPRIPATPGDRAITATAQGTAVLAAEDSRAPTPKDVAILVESAGSTDTLIQSAALRALGRLERRDVVTELLPYLRSALPVTRTEAAFAIGQGMRGERLPLDPQGTQTDGVEQALLTAAAAEKKAAPLGEMARTLGRLPYERAEQVIKADGMLSDILNLSKKLSLERRKRGDSAAAVEGAVDGAELLGRLHAKLWTPSDALIETLRGFVTDRLSQVPDDDKPAPHRALQALIAIRGLDEETLRYALDASTKTSLRRVAVTALASGASPITEEERVGYLRAATADTEPSVRYEALRAYGRLAAKTHGCQPLFDSVSDRRTEVALAAIDAIGDACAGDKDAIDRMVAEARSPASIGNTWHREAHAMVALARLSPEHTEVPLLSHSRHTGWQVRMYAARAAAILNDTATLERLAADEHDNVREATLAPLRRIKGDGAEAEFVAALGRKDYQLLRTAAIEMKGMKPTRALSTALLDALMRVTKEHKETSRDTRMAVLERLTEFGNADMQGALVPLLKDFDPKVAQAAATTLNVLTGTVFSIDPPPAHHEPLPTYLEIEYLSEFNPVLVMASGKDIELELNTTMAPMASVRFLRLAKSKYFDGLTFHRVVPNFVIQGGSPGANEYAGDKWFMRDEIRLPHVANSIGLSTRGRDTGDAQLFVNLIDNHRLDYEYTVFGRVAGKSAGRVEDVVEGDAIVRVSFVKRRLE